MIRSGSLTRREALITATQGDPSPSCSLKYRPLSNGMRKVSKYPGPGSTWSFTRPGSETSGPIALSNFIVR